MKKLLFSVTYSLAVMAALVSCSSEIEEQNLQSETTGWHKMKMEFNTSKPSFEDEATRATVGEWKDKDRLYLTFYLDGGVKVPGMAIYDSSTKTWDAEAYGDLATDSKVRTVEVMYFDTLATYNLTTFGALTVNINPQTGIYRDGNATYTNKDANIVVNARLTPATGRVRFRSDAGTSLRVSGPKVYRDYNVKSGEFTEYTASWTTSVDNTGYTPYFYATYSGLEDPTLSIRSTTPQGQSATYTTTPNTTTFLATGKSGWMNVPTVERHKGWFYKETNINYGSWSASYTDWTTIQIKEIEAGDTLVVTYRVYNQYNYSSNYLSYSLYPSTGSQPTPDFLARSSSSYDFKTYRYVFTASDVASSDIWNLYLYYYRYSTSTSYNGTATVSSVVLHKQ